MLLEIFFPGELWESSKRRPEKFLAVVQGLDYKSEEGWMLSVEIDC